MTGDDIGTYKVTLSNDLGEASTEGKLTLSGAPQFTEKITDQKTGVDEPYKIKAIVSGNPELTWYPFRLFIEQLLFLIPIELTNSSGRKTLVLPTYH